MKRTRGQRHAGKHARARAGSRVRPREPRPRRPERGLVRRVLVVALAVAALTFGSPLVSASADPKPSLKELAAKVEKMHEQIGSLTEQYNGERVRLAQAKRAADLAQKTLATSEADLEAKRHKASLLAQNAYMTGGGLSTALAFTGSGDPDGFLDRAATTYAIQQQQGQEVAEVTKAIEAAERAKASAKARAEEVTKLVRDLDAKRDQIQKLIKQTESSLFRRALASTGNSGAARRIDLPIIGKGKAAQAARWALTQQLKPYVWGAEGPNSYDCSGLVMWAYQKVGISLPHYTGDQWTAGTHIKREELRPGDLVFFYNDLHHVGIYVGGGMMVHAPRTGDVVRIAPIGNRPYAGAVRIAD
ncbi:cell wall-associated NlpC family hydrolase [Thermocatellispora tengchongensis]|uniref:Cell wall-associated NlpC family hydrolase n=1 Tax=Thermocatellispora tengchongensis TaxID=1073253 RepID=A0A840PR91_9ACTN|nr:NlpC/P60 family protein [Thermocatellispora tengchongensis]MBB5140310.1 cell wall-associated NlpC family hydrolase [Thermocatellispora tengchongensis]